MTAPTPEQMRALADLPTSNFALYNLEIRSALLAAADQIESVQPERDAALDQAVETAQLLGLAASALEAVQGFASVRATAAHALGREVERDWLDLLAILTADTAPQEDLDD